LTAPTRGSEAGLGNEGKCTPAASSPRPQSALVQAWATFLGRWSWDWFATLTFRGEVHPEAADKRFRVWVSKINRALYGPRWWKHGQGVRWVRALETQRRGVIHYHALLGGVGVDELRRLSWMDEWNRLAGYARIEPPADGAAVRGYCAKYVAKGGEVDVWDGARRSPRDRATVPGCRFHATRAAWGPEIPAPPEIVALAGAWAFGKRRRRDQEPETAPGPWETREPEAPRWRQSPAVASAASVT